MIRRVVGRSRSWLLGVAVCAAITYFTTSPVKVVIVQEPQTPPHFLTSFAGTELPLCPETPPNLLGPIVPSMEAVSLEQTAQANPAVRVGGRYRPSDCRAALRTAIIIPFRDREEHLKVLLANVLPVLQRQQLDFQLFVVTCPPGMQFNKAKLMNIAFREAQRTAPFDCFVFHDVDLLPEDDRSLYRCHPTEPRHLSVNIDKYKYRPCYDWLFGGITVHSKRLFEEVNGYSNHYWGWGGEDDDIAMRLEKHNKTVLRYADEITRYKMIKHDTDDGNSINWCRKSLLMRAKVRSDRDGLSDLRYKLMSVEELPLYTLITADTLETESKTQLRVIEFEEERAVRWRSVPNALTCEQYFDDFLKGLMDFSRVPFHAALIRLCHLVPVRTFVRIESVQPQLREHFPRRHYYMLSANRSPNGEIAMDFRLPLDGGEGCKVVYDSVEDVLNDGPVCCETLHLHRTDAIPMEGITCAFVTFYQADASIFPLITKNIRCVWFKEGVSQVPSLTLAQMCPRLPPHVDDLSVALPLFPDAIHLHLCRMTRRQGKPLKIFRLEVPCFENALKWLRTNIFYLAYGDFCENAVVYCDELVPGWRDCVRVAVFPFFRENCNGSRNLSVGAWGDFISFSHSKNGSG